MKKKCVSSFLCDECFNVLATIFLTVFVLLFIGIFFYSLGLPMSVFYALVGVGFFMSLGFSLNCIRKKRSMNNK